ncbi:MAG: UDP-N-acetylglucosamine 2-epimerase (non-hydrolyzing) [Vicinamibacterales bacterium]
MTRRRVAVFMGTRPEAIKLAPVVAALGREADIACTVVSTGQHREMLQQITDQFGIRVDADLDVMRPNQTLAELTARLMTGIDGWLAQAMPDFALVQGDTTTVLVAALACFYRRIPVGHVEAGLRTGNIWSPFPEEANRRLATPLVALHFAPTDAARQALLGEGVDDHTIAVTGNTVIDALLMEIAEQRRPAVAEAVDRALRSAVAPDWAAVPYVLVTGHRRENFGAGFDEICTGIAGLASAFPGHRFVYPLHLNPNVQAPVLRRLGSLPNVRLIAPQDYRHFVALLAGCRLVLTDSGGVQEEGAVARQAGARDARACRPSGRAASRPARPGSSAPVPTPSSSTGRGCCRMRAPTTAWRQRRTPTATARRPAGSSSGCAGTSPRPDGHVPGRPLREYRL